MLKDDQIIEINISNIDPKSVLDSKSIIQEEALEDLIEILEEDLDKDINKKDPIFKNRVHNTIFVNGKRGSGKTQLLLSIKERVKKESKRGDKLKKLKKLYFYDPIDPTLLHDNESFLTIIIAKILNDIEKKSIHSHQDRRDPERFYRLLNNLSDAIDGIINGRYQDKSSLENISQDQTSLRLEEYLHEFFAYVTKVLDKERLVLLIDDVDMAFDKGFEVLEVVRKYLSSPLIIPIITGDIELYETIVENNFIQKIDKSLKKDYAPRNNQISKDYLLKVLPGHRRIYIKTLDDISQSKWILLRDDVSSKVYFIDRVSDSVREREVYVEELSRKSAQEGQTVQFIHFLDTIERNSLTEKVVNEIIVNLLSNSLRNIVQFLHKEYCNMKDYYKLSIDSIDNIEKKYNLKLNISDWKLFYLGGLEYFTNENYEEAIKSFRRGLKISKRGEFYFILGNTYLAMGELEKARYAYESSLKLEYKIAETHYKIGEIYYTQKEYRNAKDSYSRAIENGWKHCTVYNRLGACYLILDLNGTQALENFDKAIECNMSDHKAYINKIETSFIINRPISDEFIEKFKERFKSNRKVFKAYDMFQTLTYIINEDLEKVKSTIEKKFEEWRDTYRDISYKEWNFDALHNYAENIKNIEARDLFKVYLDRFRESM